MKQNINLSVTNNIIENNISKHIINNILDININTSNTNDLKYHILGEPTISSDKLIILGSSLKNNLTFRECHIVRGSLSAKNVNNNNLKIGDPTLLMAYFVPQKLPKTHEYGIALENVVNPFDTSNQNMIINVLNPDVTDLCNKISSCKKIITNNLYIMIIANTLNVPVYPVYIDEYSYTDYLTSIGTTSKSLNHNSSLGLTVNNLSNYQILNVDIHYINQKRCEIMTVFLETFKSHGFKIKTKFINNIYDLSVGLKHLVSDMDKSKYFIGRIGGVEFDAYAYYKSNGFNLENMYIKNLFKYCGYYDSRQSVSVFTQFVKHFENYYKNCTTLLIGNDKLETYMGYRCVDDMYYNNSYYNNTPVHNIINNDILNISTKSKISYHIIESFRFFKKYFTKLNGKKILIISPFEKEIRNQLIIKDKLFVGKNMIDDFTDFKYPEFKSVEYINTFLTTNNFQQPHTDIMVTFEHYKKIIKTKDFDVALLICGAYSYLFGDFIYGEMNKSCMHMGGVGQLLFGIKGGRYLIQYFESMMNENWIYPHSIINESAQGKDVPSYDGLLGYFGRK
ncbi:hypothetical protein QLL95_gp0922 [Cotonvirus japonicus]|uniref:Uncharacterized protein n=1 Tax=Cotonvirus japonicus TaxID=2811091 RepID=A0ABM7NSX1_9VIRU|nr:hypothetical protein QLL95_gp0922 [Cotonvirus japonicus]BCS83201.1 hypothetical protein [Cotonvirus japonicus]